MSLRRVKIGENERKEAMAIADRIVDEVTKGYVPNIERKYVPFRESIGLDNDSYGMWG